jgi:hypothetical protein
VFVTAQGSNWPRLRRALDHGNLVEALSAASELEHVGLAEALELLLLIRDQEPAKVRARRASLARSLLWRGSRRHCSQAQAVLVLLSMIAGKQGKTAAQALADLLYGRRLRADSEALVRWSE